MYGCIYFPLIPKFTCNRECILIIPCALLGYHVGAHTTVKRNSFLIFSII